MITHAAFPKTILYCFIGPPRKTGAFLLFAIDSTIDVEFIMRYSKSKGMNEYGKEPDCWQRIQK